MEEPGYESAVRFEINPNDAGRAHCLLSHSGLTDEKCTTSHNKGDEHRLKRSNGLHSENGDPKQIWMSKYIFAYHGGKRSESPESGAKLMARRQAWIGDFGNSVVNPGDPVGLSKTVGSDGGSDDGGANPLSGYSIVPADSVEAAVEMDKIMSAS